MRIEHPPFITSAEVARRLGVGDTAVKRWADQGVLRCIRTVGGHRRFLATDVDQLRSHHATESGDEWETWIKTLVESGSVHAVLSLLFAERARHGSWWRTCERLAGLLDALGTRWAKGTLTVAQEHVASALLHRSLSLVAETMVVARDTRCCLLAPAEGEEHTFGLSFAELCLREEGWRAEWMGTRTRTFDVCERISTGAVQMVALSASAVMTDRRLLRRQAQKVGVACIRENARLALGGSGAWPVPPSFGVRLRQWDAFADLVRHS